MKKSCFIIILIILAFFSVACSSTEEDEMRDEKPAVIEETGHRISHNYDTHFFLSERVPVNISPGGVLQGSMLHKDTLYYYYTATGSLSGNDIVIASHSFDTGETSRIIQNRAQTYLFT